jgi:TetR/AcrR family transcriptional regulator, repressor of fatR-cypB operon
MPKSKDDNKISAIHSAAQLLVVHKGYYALKMADVAHEAKIATGTLYIYYDSKESLINAVYTETKAEITAVILDPNHQVAEDYIATFSKMWHAYFTYCVKHPEKMIFVEQLIYSGIIDPAIILDINEKMKGIDDFILLGQSLGILKSAPVEMIKSLMNGAIHEVIRASISHQAILGKQEATHLFNMTWDAIKK